MFITFKPYNIKYIDSCIMGALYVEKKSKKKKFSWKTFAQKKTFFSIRWTWQQKLDWGFCEVHIWSILLCYNLIYWILLLWTQKRREAASTAGKKICSSHRNIKHSALKIAFMESEWNRQKETCSNTIFNFSISSIYNFQFCMLFCFV